MTLVRPANVSTQLMTIVAALDVTKAFGARVLLAGASFSLDEGERVGVVGRNGAGKSTFAKILAGAEPPDSGSVVTRRGVRVAYLAQEPELDPEKTVQQTVEDGLAAWLEARQRHDDLSRRIASGGDATEALVLAQVQAATDIERLGGWDRSHEVDRVLDHLQLRHATARPTRTLSGGQKRRVALARVLIGAPDVMLLDEPTNHLDADTIEWLETFLVESFRGAVVLVTHDRWLLDRVADRTLEVDSGNVHSYDGGYASFLEARSERLALEQRTERNRQNFLRTELEWLRRQPKARSTKQKSRIARAETARDTEAPREIARVELTTSTVSESGRTVIDLRNVGLQVPGEERWLVKNLHLTLTNGDRLGIVGPNGAGKTTLLRAIAREFELTEGEIVLGRRVRVGYLDQQRAGLDPTASVFETVAQAVPLSTSLTAGSNANNADRIDPRSYLERFGFPVATAQKQKVGALSGGERARLALARLLASSANLLLLDEPSNDLDTDTLSALEDFLSTYEGSLLVVTHDRYLLDRVTTGILCFEGDGQVTRYAGAYQAYAAARSRTRMQTPSHAHVRARDARSGAVESTSVAKDGAHDPSAASPDATALASSSAAAAAKPRGAKPGLSKNEQKELAGIMDKIEAAEAAVAAIEAELSDPSLYVNGQPTARVDTIHARLADARRLATTLTERWEQLEAKQASLT